MGTIDFVPFDYPSGVGLKSMQLLETLYKWHDSLSDAEDLIM